MDTNDFPDTDPKPGLRPRGLAVAFLILVLVGGLGWAAALRPGLIPGLSPEPAPTTTVAAPTTEATTPADDPRPSTTAPRSDGGGETRTPKVTTPTTASPTTASGDTWPGRIRGQDVTLGAEPVPASQVTVLCSATGVTLEGPDGTTVQIDKPEAIPGYSPKIVLTPAQGDATTWQVEVQGFMSTTWTDPTQTGTPPSFDADGTVSSNGALRSGQGGGGTSANAPNESGPSVLVRTILCDKGWD